MSSVARPSSSSGSRRIARAIVLVAGLVAGACTATETRPPAPPPSGAPEAPNATKATASRAPEEAPTTPSSPQSSAIVVPTTLPTALAPRKTIATGLQNPRGMLALDDGVLLVSEAGTGVPKNPDTGALVRMADRNDDGDYDDAGERESILSRMHSANILEIVRRDEVFGMAAIARGGGTIVATHAMFGSPTTLYRVSPDGKKAEKWSVVHGNLNALAYHPKRGEWLAASSSSDEVVRVRPEGGSERIVKFAPLEQGQDAVPGYLAYEPRTDQVLVTLFSGSPEGEEGGTGIELVQRSGKIVRVHPETGVVQTVVEGLTAPTDLLVGEGGRLWVLELTDGFADPVPKREAMSTAIAHGGFRRFTGRLLAIDLDARTVTVIADRLDTPTNLARDGAALLVATGMGTPGRRIPGPNGPVALDGTIERIEVK